MTAIGLAKQSTVLGLGINIRSQFRLTRLTQLNRLETI